MVVGSGRNKGKLEPVFLVSFAWGGPAVDWSSLKTTGEWFRTSVSDLVWAWCFNPLRGCVHYLTKGIMQSINWKAMNTFHSVSDNKMGQVCPVSGERLQRQRPHSDGAWKWASLNHSLSSLEWGRPAFVKYWVRYADSGPSTLLVGNSVCVAFALLTWWAQKLEFLIKFKKLKLLLIFVFIHKQNKRARELAISADKMTWCTSSLSQLCKKLDMVAHFKFHHKGGRDR